VQVDIMHEFLAGNASDASKDDSDAAWEQTTKLLRRFFACWLERRDPPTPNELFNRGLTTKQQEAATRLTPAQELALAAGYDVVPRRMATVDVYSGAVA
jgi:hypothetical protein